MKRPSDLTTEEYRKLTATGSREPDRRRSSDYYSTQGVKTEPGLQGHSPRIYVFPNNGNPRVVKCKKSYVPPTL